MKFTTEVIIKGIKTDLNDYIEKSLNYNISFDSLKSFFKYNNLPLEVICNPRHFYSEYRTQKENIHIVIVLELKEETKVYPSVSGLITITINEFKLPDYLIHDLILSMNEDFSDGFDIKYHIDTRPNNSFLIVEI